MSYPKRHTISQKNISKKLRRRLQIYFFISIILFIVVCYEIIVHLVPFSFALIGIVVGTAIGFIAARMFHLSWNHDAQEIVSRLDLFGIGILILYIVFAIFRTKIIGHFVHGSSVGGISLSTANGVMIGRVLGTRGRIIKILREQKLLH